MLAARWFMAGYTVRVPGVTLAKLFHIILRVYHYLIVSVVNCLRNDHIASKTVNVSWVALAILAHKIIPVYHFLVSC